MIYIYFLHSFCDEWLLTDNIVTMIVAFIRCEIICCYVHACRKFAFVRMSLGFATATLRARISQNHRPRVALSTADLCHSTRTCRISRQQKAGGNGARLANRLTSSQQVDWSTGLKAINQPPILPWLSPSSLRPQLIINWSVRGGGGGGGGVGLRVHELMPASPSHLSQVCY